jgi:hypothetical protein
MVTRCDGIHKNRIFSHSHIYSSNPERARHDISDGNENLKSILFGPSYNNQKSVFLT